MYADDLLPHLLELNEWRDSPVWARADKLFRDKAATLPESALRK
jgi:saccharopine dehydrogenase (NAD+, L-lysine-forming)